MNGKIKITRNFLSFCLCLALILTCISFSFITAFAEEGVKTVGDFTIAPANGSDALVENTDYVYTEGKLTIQTAVPVIVSMKEGVEKTAEVIVVDSKNGQAAVTFKNIYIETAKNEAITAQGSEKITMYFSGVNNLVSADTGVDVSNKTPVKITSIDEGQLNISNVKYGIACITYSTSEMLEITGNINIHISGCTMHAIYYKEGAVSISGMPIITIDTVEYAIYGIGISISGGTFWLKNDDGYMICSGRGNSLTLSGQTDMHITEGDRGLYSSDNGKITITDSAKLKVYGGDANNKTAAILEYAINAGELLIEKNAFVDMFTKEDAISGGITKITDNAQVNIKINCESTYSQYALRFDSTLDICANTKVNIDITGSKIYGLYDITDSTVNISDEAEVKINGAYRSVYADFLHLSGNSSLTITEDLSYAVYGVTTIQNTAKLTATSLNAKVLYDTFTVKPAEDKAYMVRAGATEAAAVPNYYIQETSLPEKSAWRYFCAVPVDEVPVSSSGTNKTITYNGSSYDVSQMFTIDGNAGAASYEIIEGGTGAGVLNGNILTVTKAGTICIKLTTEAAGLYASGEATATLTVKKGTGSGTVTVAGWTYGDAANAPVVQSATHGNIKVRYLYESTDGKGYTSEAAPVCAGSYKLTVTFEVNDLYEAFSAETTFTIAQKELTPILTGTVTKVYDGTNAVPADHHLSIALDGIVSNDEVGATAAYTYDNQNAGTTKVIAADIILSGAAKDNYKLTNATVSGEVGEITPKNIKGVKLTLGNALMYTGEEQTQDFSINTLDHLTVTYRVSGNTATNVGVYVLTVTGTGNFTGTESIRYTVAPDISPIKDITAENVTSGNKADIEAFKETLVNAEMDLASDEEKAELQAFIDKCDDLLAVIYDVSNSVKTENIEKVEDITADTVKKEDKTALENAKADLVKALEENGDNFTDEEKDAIQAEIDRIDEARKVLDAVETIENKINNLPKRITEKDEAAIRAADTAYNDLSAYEKSLVSGEAKQILGDAKAALAALKADSSQTGDNSNIWLWGILLLISSGMSFGISFTKRKKLTQK